jgi:hypothetical protein
MVIAVNGSDNKYTHTPTGLLKMQYIFLCLSFSLRENTRAYTFLLALLRKETICFALCFLRELLRASVCVYIINKYIPDTHDHVNTHEAAQLYVN